jgi:hypothetical protein
VAALLVTVGSVNALAPQEGIVALPLAFAAGMAVRVALLLVALAFRVRTIGPASADG